MWHVLALGNYSVVSWTLESPSFHIPMNMWHQILHVIPAATTAAGFLSNRRKLLGFPRLPPLSWPLLHAGTFVKRPKVRWTCRSFLHVTEITGRRWRSSCRRDLIWCWLHIMAVLWRIHPMIETWYIPSNSSTDFTAEVEKTLVLPKIEAEPSRKWFTTSSGHLNLVDLTWSATQDLQSNASWQLPASVCIHFAALATRMSRGPPRNLVCILSRHKLDL